MKVSEQLHTPAALISGHNSDTPQTGESRGPEPFWTVLEKRKIFYPARGSNTGQSKQFLK